MKKLGTLFTLIAINACSPKVSVKAVKAVTTAVESTVTTVNSGTIEADQQAVLGFGTTGRVTKVNVRLGDAVKRGQVLAELENTDLKSSEGEATAELERSKKLFAEGLVAPAALDESRRGFEIAHAAWERSLIRAPFDGIITELNLQSGQLAQATTDKAAIRIVDAKPRIIRGDIDEIDLSKVRPGAIARVKILAARAAAFKASVTKVIPFIATTREQDRSSQIELKFEEDTNFIPVGASADIEIIVGAKDKTLAVPTKAVFGAGDQRHVFRDNGGKLEKVPVKLGIGNYDRSEILEGIKEGDLVVIPASDTDLHDGQKVKVETQPWP